MDIAQFLGESGLGIVLGLAAIGSALGVGAVGTAAAGAWAREARAGKALNFTYILLAGLPLSQTIYAFVMMLVGLQPAIIENPQLMVHYSGLYFGLAVGVGLAELFSAWMQGMIGAAACRCLSEGEGKGFAFLIILMGIAETVGLFVFVFLLMAVPKA